MLAKFSKYRALPRRSAPLLKVTQSGVEYTFDSEQFLVSRLEARIDDLLHREKRTSIAAKRESI